jgi:hypothetical protein
MSTDDESTANLPKLPKKLAGHIDELPDAVNDGETIVGNGNIKLTSEHPVSVVEYFLTVHADGWSNSTYKVVAALGCVL